MTNGDTKFDTRIEALDLSLFDGIPTQSCDGDRRSWLAVQRSVRRPAGYTYLEIGSHLGGSLQQHLLDPLCRRIISIDKRPPDQPDDRGTVYTYLDNSTARMLDNLRKVAPTELSKITCFDADAKDIDPRLIPDPPGFCFIDGEHTRAAVLSDFGFTLSVCAPNAAICFHDDYMVFEALKSILTLLRSRGIAFRARKLDGSTFGIFLRDCPAANDPIIRDFSDDGLRWLRMRSVGELIPSSLRPGIHRVYRSLGILARHRAVAGKG
jgi:hypothetical protein